ncbi:hypothetical protein [Blastopirellula retiformator]|uniref:Transmembrane protein n=1 Tax=Blastopirellula retiformator TaxID=2527970 RepID=A0A5C5V4D4_9BACT|nr:hypothetical protein [Blastopirellula retiformator]TWT33418.1 hypothetical protein Enr8_32490 [Blastopirellula retiformator]
MDEKPTDDKSLADLPPVAETLPPSTPLKSRAVDAILFIIAGAGALVLLGGTLTPCMGATRSAKLKWEERQMQIEQAVRDAEASQSETE